MFSSLTFLFFNLCVCIILLNKSMNYKYHHAVWPDSLWVVFAYSTGSRHSVPDLAEKPQNITKAAICITATVIFSWDTRHRQNYGEAFVKKWKPTIITEVTWNWWVAQMHVLTSRCAFCVSVFFKQNVTTYFIWMFAGGNGLIWLMCNYVPLVQRKEYCNSGNFSVGQPRWQHLSEGWTGKVS